MFHILHHGFRLPQAAIVVGSVALLVLGLLATSRLGAEDPPTPEDSYPRIFIGKPDGSEMKPLVDLDEYKSQG
jgi:hypothetical protein